MNAPTHGLHDRERQTLLQLRWVLIVATAYLLLFHHPGYHPSPFVGVFLALYLGSNLVVGALLRRVRSDKRIEMGVALFDAMVVSLALLVTQEFSGDFFLLYFVVIFLAALTERLAFVVATAVLVSILHLYATMGHLGLWAFFASGALLRIPFLFVVALFFGHLVERIRAAERDAAITRENEKVITDFVSDVVRDLKTPLGAIQAMAEIVLEPQTGPLTLEQAELLRRVHANARHVTRIASNLLDARHLLGGRLWVVREPVDLRDVVAEVLTVVRTASELKGISLDFEVAADLPRADVDVNQIDRVVWNLLDNAIRCAPTGGEVFVSLEHSDREIILSVSDDGPGISSEDLPTVFDRLRHPKRRFSSSGIALFVAQAIVEAHGGTITVDSEPEGGTTFTVRLPISRRTDAPPLAAAC